MAEVLGIAAKSAILLFVLLTVTAYLTWWERRLIGFFQIRVGPNRVGPAGLLQPAADAIKMLFKEWFIPASVDRFTYLLAPAIIVVSALLVYAVIPVGPAITLFGRTIPLWLADVNVGILFVLAVSSVGVYGVILGGWSSDNKYALLGGLRSSAQLISYELALGLGVLGAVLLAGSLSLVDIVRAQLGFGWFAWRLPAGPLAFLIFLIAGMAETNRAPFDLPEAEQELIAGYHTEYGGFKFGMFYVAEYTSVITQSALVATLFFGGWDGPVAPGPWWFALKVFVFASFYVWARATVPRVRYDQLMNLGWKVLLPVGLLNVAAASAAIVLRGG